MTPTKENPNKKQRRNKALRKVKEYFQELCENQGDS